MSLDKTKEIILSKLAFAEANNEEEWVSQREDLALLTSFFSDFFAESIEKGVISAMSKMFPKS